jgi:hypothetical protein
MFLQKLFSSILPYLTILIFSFHAHFSFSQHLLLVKKFKTSPICASSIDAYGNLLLAFQDGNIQKYDSLGKELYLYSPEKAACVTSMEAWTSVQIFAFYREFQEFIWFNRFLALSERARLSSDVIGFALLATPSADGNIWIFDQVSFSLKKYSPILQNILQENRLDLVFNQEDFSPTFLREYQNQLWMYDKKMGLLTFDIMGNFEKKEPIYQLDGISFWGDFGYYLSNKKWIERHLYNQEIYESELPELSENGLKILRFHQKIFLIETDEVKIFDMK